MKMTRIEHTHVEGCFGTPDKPTPCTAERATIRIECRAEDIEFDPSKAVCSGLMEVGTELVPCDNHAEWWVGDDAACSDCIATFLNDEKSTVVVPIASLPMPSLEDCLYHRCLKHREVPQLNTSDGWSECGACVQVAQREATQAEERRLSSSEIGALI